MYTNADWNDLTIGTHILSIRFDFSPEHFLCFLVRFLCISSTPLSLSSTPLYRSLYYSILLNLICNIENHWLDFNVRGFFRLNKHSRYHKSLVDSFKWNKRFPIFRLIFMIRDTCMHNIVRKEYTPHMQREKNSINAISWKCHQWYNQLLI